MNIGLSAVLLLFGLACNQSPKEIPDQRPPIAHVREPVADVRSRKAQQLAWNAAQDGTPLSNRDAVRTGDSSTAKVLFNDYTRINVSPQTTIIIEDKKATAELEQSILAMKKGHVVSELTASPGMEFEIVLKTRKGWLKARTSSKAVAAKPVRFETEIRSDGSLNVQNTQGQLTFVTREKELSIAPRQKLVVPGNHDDVKALSEADTPPSDEPLDAPPSFSREEWKTIEVIAPDEFVILSPKTGTAITASEIQIEGRLTGKLEAVLNGKELHPNDKGVFTLTLPLSLGTNLFTFQILGPGPNDVRYETLTVVRK